MDDVADQPPDPATTCPAVNACQLIDILTDGMDSNVFIPDNTGLFL